MKILFNNVFYDDCQDPTYQYCITLPTPIQAKIFIKQVDLIILHEQIKLLQILARMINIQFNRNIDNSQILVNCQEIVGYQFNAFQQIEKTQIILQNFETNKILEYIQTNQKTGQKHILIKITGINGSLNLEWLFTAINFFILDDTVQIILPQDHKILKPLTLELIIEKVQCTIQNSLDNQFFQAKGNLFLIFQKNQTSEIHQNYHEAMHPGEIQELNDKIQSSPSSCLKIESSELSLFTNDFNREIFGPISLQWKSMNYQCLCFKNWQNFNESTLNIENLKLVLTIRECQQLSKAIKFQTQSMWESNQFGEQQWSEQYSLISQSRKLLNIQQLEVWIVNSKFESYFPILTINLSAMPLIIQQSYMKLLLSANITMESFYFNCMAGELEPVMERFSFDVAMVRNKISYPRMFLQIEPNKSTKFSQLNLNLHQNFIVLLTSLAKRNKPRKSSINLKNTNKQEQVESNDSISLYHLENQTGYDLKVIIEQNVLYIKNLEKQAFKTNLNKVDGWQQYNKISIQFQSLDGSEIKMNFRIDSNSKQFWKLNNKQYCFYIQQKMSKSIRIIRISSVCAFENCTPFQEYVLIFSQSHLIWNQCINPNEKVIPPCELMDENNQIRIDLFEQQSFNINIHSLFHKEFTYLELQQGDLYTILTIQKNETQQFGRKLFKLKSPLIIQNCLPIIFDININGKSFTVENQQQLSLHQFTQRQILTYSLKIENYTTGSLTLHKPFVYTLNQVSECLLEQQSKKIGLQLYQQLDQGTLICYFYPRIFLVDTTLHNLRIFTLQKDQQIPLAKINQYYTFLLEESTIIFETQSFYSNEVFINAIGDTSFQIKKKLNENYELLEFGLNISLMQTKAELGVYSRMIEISPRYVLINCTKSVIHVQQQDSYGKMIIIQPSSRTPYHWQDCTKEKMIVIRIANDNDDSTNWSEGLYLSDMRTIHFYCYKKITKSKIFLNCTISKRKATFFISINQEIAPYKLVNQCSQNVLQISQASNNQQEERLNPNETIDFSWKHPSLKPLLNIKIENISLQLDLFRSDDYYKLKIKDNSYLLINVEFEEHRKVIIFKDDDDEKSKKASIINSWEQKINKLIYINMGMITISVISNVAKPLELNLVTLSGTEIGISEINSVVSYQIKVKFINLDNNYHENALNKVLFTPSFYDSLIDSDKCALNVKLAQNYQNEYITMIEYFYAQLVPFSIKLDQEYLTHALQMIETIKQELPKNENKIPMDQFQIVKYLFTDNQSQANILKQLQFINGQEINPYLEWLIVEIPPPKGSIYIKSLILPLFHFELSFSSLYQQNPNFVLNLLANSFDSAIKNIENAPIKLKGIKMVNIFDTATGVQALLKEHYKFAMLQQILPIIGSIEMFGNPLSFFSRISTGVIDLIEKPIEAMSQGPLEMGLGVLEGAASLIKNTVAGAFYSVNKITGSMANQISILSLDNQYIQQRRKFMSRKPTQVVEGIYFGIQSLLHGVGDGILGFFVQPYQGGKKDGALGILKGSAIGLAGVVIKPLAGVFDAASKTAEGLTNTATHFDDRPREQRMRLIRAFYENSRYIKVYSDDDAYFLNKFPDLILIDIFQIFDIELQKIMHLIIAQNMLLYVNINNGTRWQSPANQIQEFKMFQDPNSETTLRLYLMLQQQALIKIKFTKAPISYYLGQKLQYMISLNKQL